MTPALEMSTFWGAGGAGVNGPPLGAVWTTLRAGRVLQQGLRPRPGGDGAEEGSLGEVRLLLRPRWADSHGPAPSRAGGRVRKGDFRAELHTGKQHPTARLQRGAGSSAGTGAAGGAGRPR